jgi:hypothetical protein
MELKMIRRLSFSVFAMLFAVGPAHVTRAAEVPSETEIAKLIAGKWYQVEVINDISTKATTTFRKDGTFSGEAMMTKGERTLKLTVTGTWKVAGSKLIETIEKSEPPGIPSGKQSTDEVLEINEKTFRYRTEEGKERTATRVTE